MDRKLKLVKDAASQDAATLQLKPCPQCAEPVAWEGNAFRPFCSQRCRTLDLGAWANEEYTVPVNDPVANFENEEF